MKRVLLILALASVAASGPAEARRVVTAAGSHTAVVLVGEGWPLHRAPRLAVIHMGRSTVQVASRSYLPAVAFPGAATAAAVAPSRDGMAWEDGETLAKREDWTEFTLVAGALARRIWLEIDAGKVQFDWAEVVFDNGDSQVVDFGEKSYGAGLYSMLDLKAGRRVDHIRVLARAKSGEAKVILRLQK